MTNIIPFKRPPQARIPERSAADLLPVTRDLYRLFEQRIQMFSEPSAATILISFKKILLVLEVESNE